MLYEFGYQFRVFDIVKILIFVLPLCLYMFSDSFDSKFLKRSLCVISGLLTVSFILVFYISPLYSFFKIKHNISAGNVLTVEGEVTDFCSPEDPSAYHDSESFSINGVKFCYYGTENYGYSTFLHDGGIITGNGQNLRIIYCEDPFSGEFVICSIEQK